MKDYFKERAKLILTSALVLIFINVYFAVLCASRLYFQDLFYLDAVLIAAGAAGICLDYRRWSRIPRFFGDNIRLNRNELVQLLGKQMADLLCSMEEGHEEEYRFIREEMDVLTDYITRWTHEVKLPLSALGLMNERNPDGPLKKEMQDCLERIQQLLNTMMMSNKLKSMENDVKFERVSLGECVSEALKNQSYFLIQEHFQIGKDCGDIAVYTDRRWLVYMLDQLTGNAVKYRCREPELHFSARRESAEHVVLCVRDNGIGIEDAEIPYIFDRGYIGSNLRAGDYRSTGMGLYFVRETAEHLGIRIQVYSEPGTGTAFELHFQNNDSYLIL